MSGYQEGEGFHPHPPHHHEKSEHPDHPKHKPGVKASPNDNAPEFSARTYAPGSAPADKSFQPRPVQEIPGQALNENMDPSARTTATSTLGGASSADVNKGLGQPMEGESSVEYRHGGEKHRKHQGSGLEGVGANPEKVEAEMKRLSEEGHKPKSGAA